MSMMKCDECSRFVDTDSDPDSLYVPEAECLCKGCRNQLGLPSEFEK